VNPRPIVMGRVVKCPRVRGVSFIGAEAIELTVVHKVGPVCSTIVETRRVRGLPAPSLPLTGEIPRSRLEIVANGAVVFRRAFSPPHDRDGWVLVTLVPDVPGADRILATGPLGLWLQHALP
jgi:hypothetical protein